jgi:hypothetical protein
MRWNMAADNWIAADWPAPAWISAGTTTRNGGFSDKPYDSFNLALHVGDDAIKVKRNREKLYQRLNLPADPVWLNQVHGCKVADGEQVTDAGTDGCFTRTADIVCAVMTADCIPLLMCNESGTRVAAIHVGWRGLCRGIIANSVVKFNETRERLLAWLGPSICAHHYPVQDDMRNICLQSLSTAAVSAFSPAGNGRWFADIEKLAKTELERLGVSAIYVSGRCTYSEADEFYSYRRDGKTGRMASLIWISDNVKR